MLTVIETPSFQRLWQIWLLLICAKSVADNIPVNVLRDLKKEFDDAND